MAKKSKPIQILISLALILLGSLVYLVASLIWARITQHTFQIYLWSHMALALITVGGLLWHLLPQFSIKILFPIIAIILWLLNTLAQRCRRRRERVEISGIVPIYSQLQINSTDKGLTAVRLTLHSESLLFGPGSFYYIRFGKQPLLTKFQYHPFLVAWWDNERELNGTGDIERIESKEREGKRSVTFLLHAQSALSAWLARSNSVHQVSLDGPYGQDLQLGRYHTVTLVGNGLGIVGILPYAQHLLERWSHDHFIKERLKHFQNALESEQKQYQANSNADEAHCASSFERMMEMRQELRKLENAKINRDLTKKVDLYWVLDANYQHQWVDDRLKKMQDDDSAQVRL